MTVEYKVASLLLVVLIPVTARSVLAQEMDTLKAGVVRVSAEKGTRKGSGFIVSVDQGAIYIVTASHVVAEAADIQVEFFRGSSPFSAAVVKQQRSESLDLALLKVTDRRNPPSSLSILPLASSVHFEGGEKVSIVGVPAITGLWSVVDDSVVTEDGPYIVLKAQLEDGWSGSPVIRNRQVVGLVTSTVERALALNASIVLPILQAWPVPPLAKELKSLSQKIETSPQTDLVEIRRVVYDSQIFETLNIYANPETFNENQLSEYWVSAEQGGKSVDKIKRAVRQELEKGWHYGPPPVSKVVTFDFLDTRISGDYAEVDTREEWYLPYFDKSGNRVFDRDPKLGPYRLTYYLRKINGKWLIHNTTTPMKQ